MCEQSGMLLRCWWRNWRDLDAILLVMRRRIYRLGVEEMQEGEYKIITSGREEGEHRRGVALVLSRVAQKTLIGHSSISVRIIFTKFLSSRFMPHL